MAKERKIDAEVNTPVIKKSKKYQLFESLQKKGYPVSWENGLIYFKIPKGDTITEKSVIREMTGPDGTPKCSWGYRYVDVTEKQGPKEESSKWNYEEPLEDL